MKRKILLPFALLLATSAGAQILNAGFEDWTGGNPDSWVSSNIQAASFVNISQTSDNNSGLSAVHGEVAYLNALLVTPFIQSGTGGTGFTISERHAAVQLFYKFLPVAGDRFAVNIAFEKNGNVIAQGAVALPNTVSAYTSLTVPLTYTSLETPDLATIQILILGPTGADHHEGSEMFVDDISFSGISALDENTFATEISSLYPNPASDQVMIASGNHSYSQVEILDMLGNTISKVDLDYTNNVENLIHISVADLPSGSYFYSLSNDELKTKGKFVVQH